MDTKVSNKMSSHIVTLDMLRGLAAISVVGLHWFEANNLKWFGNGYLSVDLFFALSGFVLSHAYQEKLLNGLKFIPFLVSRIIRLYPLLIFGALLGFLRQAARLIILDEGSSDILTLTMQLITSSLAVPWTFRGGEYNPFVEMFPINTVIWSLFFEIVASIAYGAWIFRANTKVLITIILFALIGCIWWIFAMGEHDILRIKSNSNNVDALIFGLSRVTLSFCVGVAIFRLPKWPKLSFFAVPLTCAVMLLVAMPHKIYSPIIISLILLILFPLTIKALAVYELRGPALQFGKLMGDVSYPLYLIHVPVMWTSTAVLKQIGIVVDPYWGGLIIIPALCLLSLVVLKLYDEPVRFFLRQKYVVR